MNWKPGTPMRLETEHYYIRPLISADVTDRFVAWLQDPEVMEFVDLPMNLRRDQFIKYIRRFDNRKSFCLGVFSRETGKCIGFFQVFCDLRNRNARSAIVLGDKSYWGKKTVIEARSALLDFLFDVMDLHKVWGAIYSRNFPSIFNYKALGFRTEGIIKEQFKNRHGDGWHDVVRFGLLKDEWHARRQANKEITR